MEPSKTVVARANPQGKSKEKTRPLSPGARSQQIAFTCYLKVDCRGQITGKIVGGLGKEE